MTADKLHLCEKNIIGLENFSAAEIRLVLDVAKDMKKLFAAT